jgi:hypothetical protein
MSLLQLFCVAFITTLVTACGGGSNSTSAKSYSFVSPQLNSVRTYAQTFVDNSTNIISLSFTDTTTTVNSNGSYVELENDPSNNSVIVNGTTYSIHAATYSHNNSGQITSYFYPPTGGIPTTCTYAPHGAGPDFPITIGQVWSLTFTITCGSSPAISYSQTGTVIDVESVTVPAGTYSAVKLQSTLSWTAASGTTYMEAITSWRDVNTGIPVKNNSSYTYGGTPQTNGYPVTTSTVLQSGSP